jgi:hypothetical protein
MTGKAGISELGIAAQSMSSNTYGVGITVKQWNGKYENN